MTRIVVLIAALCLVSCRAETPSGPGAELPHPMKQDAEQCAERPDAIFCGADK